MTTYLQPVFLTTWRLWAGRIITGLVVIFLVFDGVTKIIQVTPVVEASTKLGLAPDLLFDIGIMLLACTAIFAIPKTAILGSILLTGYLGGATAIHVRAGLGRTGPSRTQATLVDHPAAVLNKPRQT